MNSAQAYWKECISIAADECELTLSEEQLTYLASSAESGHENYGMAFYSPSDDNSLTDVESRWQYKLDEKQKELDRYQRNAEEAIKKALRLHCNDNVAICEGGEVLQYGGRTKQIQ